MVSHSGLVLREKTRKNLDIDHQKKSGLKEAGFVR